MNTTENETKHTLGALRAAQIIHCLVPAHRTVDVMATMIDRETHAPALLAALETMLDASWNGLVDCDHPARKQAAAAIASARGEKEGA